MIGLPLLRDYLASLNLSAGRITLRNRTDAAWRRLAHDAAAISSFRTDMSNVWIPATVDGRVGLAHLDSGHPYTWVDAAAAPEGEVGSFEIAGLDLLVVAGDVAPQVRDQSANYESLPFDVIANIGADVLRSFVVTIDQQQARLLLHKAGDAGR